MKVYTHLVIVLAFGILSASGFRIEDNYKDGGWGLDIQQGEHFLQDSHQMLLEEAMELLQGNRKQQVIFYLKTALFLIFLLSQNPELRRLRGLSITNNLEVLKERLINRIGRKRSQQVQALLISYQGFLKLLF